MERTVLERIAWANRWSFSQALAVAAEHYVTAIDKVDARISGQ